MSDLRAFDWDDLAAWYEEQFDANPGLRGRAARLAELLSGEVNPCTPYDRMLLECARVAGLIAPH